MFLGAPAIGGTDGGRGSCHPELVAEVLQTMLELAEEGMTMICVTHEMAFARKVANRVVFMEAGGGPDESWPCLGIREIGVSLGCAP